MVPVIDSGFINEYWTTLLYSIFLCDLSFTVLQSFPCVRKIGVIEMLGHRWLIVSGQG